MIHVGLVLSGGGALGAAHIGVIRAMEERVYVPDFVAGVSIGAVIGACVACGMTSAAMARIVDDAKILPLLVDPFGAGAALSSGQRLLAFFEKVFGDQCIEDLAIPLWIGTTDFDTGARVMISRGRIVDALRASVCVPILFAPYYHPTERRLLVDGGLTQNFPVDTAIMHYGGQQIIASDVTALTPLVHDHDEAHRFFAKSRTLLRYHQRIYRIFFAQQQKNIPYDPRVIMIAPPVSTSLAVKFHQKQIASLIEKGYTAAQNVFLMRDAKELGVS